MLAAKSAVAAAAVIVLPYFLAAFAAVPPGAGNWLLRVLPAAGFALQQPYPAYHQVTMLYAPFSGYFPLAPLAGLAVAATGGEYGTGMIGLTLAAVPRRLTAFTAKALVTAAAALAAAMAAVGGSALAGRLILSGRGLSAASGYPPLSLSDPADLRAVVGSVLYLVLIALLAFGVTAAVHDSAAGTGLVLGVLFLLPIVATVIPDEVLARHLEQLSPMTAGLYVQVTTGVTSLPLTPWQGPGVTAAWAAGALLLGAALFRFRDA